MTLCSLEMHLLLTFMSFQFKIELDILFEGQCVMEIKDFSNGKNTTETQWAVVEVKKYGLHSVMK